MKKVKKSTWLCFVALIIALFTVITGALCFGNGVQAGAVNDYDNYIAGYNIVYDIRADRTMTVTEDLTFHFYQKSGFVRDIPVNGGEKVQNIKVKEIKDGKEQSVYHKVTAENDDKGNYYICVDMGSQQTKNGLYTYHLTYDYIVPETEYEKKNNIIALAPIGRGYAFKIENIDLEIRLPEGYVNDDRTKCFIDGFGQTQVALTSSTENGKTVLRAHVDYLSARTGLRFDAGFEEGVLTEKFDFTPYIFVIIAVALIFVIIIVKALVYSKSHLTPVVNFEAPDSMDPLLMGKLIDTRINNEDISSMIIYFADKGYLEIDLTDENNPTLIRKVKLLPNKCADYETEMFEGLFERGETVKISELKYRFYKTVERVTSKINAKTRGLYTGKSMCVAAAFAFIGGILLGLAPFILAFFTISKTYFVLAPFLAIVPILVVFGASQTVKWYSLKFDKKKKALFSALIALLCVAVSLVYALLSPAWIMGFLPKFLLCAAACAASAVSVTVISRSDKYTEQLNQIVGFKNFILLAEKDRLEKLIEDDPQFYYHILPYAQVLGVSDKWEEKFKDITVQPPNWATRSAMDTAFSFYMFNSIMRRSMTSMSKNMYSRPSSSGASGGGRSHFGGFSGGGHGGGGGHFR